MLVIPSGGDAVGSVLCFHPFASVSSSLPPPTHVFNAGATPKTNSDGDWFHRRAATTPNTSARQSSRSAFASSAPQNSCSSSPLTSHIHSAALSPDGSFSGPSPVAHLPCADLSALLPPSAAFDLSSISADPPFNFPRQEENFCRRFNLPPPSPGTQLQPYESKSGFIENFASLSDGDCISHASSPVVGLHHNRGGGGYTDLSDNSTPGSSSQWTPAPSCSSFRDSSLEMNGVMGIMLTRTSAFASTSAILPPARTSTSTLAPIASQPATTPSLNQPRKRGRPRGPPSVCPHCKHVFRRRHDLMRHLR